MRHTPGPWEVGYPPGVCIVKSPLHGIATLHIDGTQAEREANANLIAAAPNLLEALKEALPPEGYSGWWCPTCKCAVPGKEVTFEEYHESCGTYLGNCQSETWVDRAREIIKKTEGK